MRVRRPRVPAGRALPALLLCGAVAGPAMGCTGEPTALPAEVPWSAVSVGGGHTCALDREGRVACRGLNHRGQLGHGGRTDRGAFVPVGLGRGVLQVSAGDAHTCAIDDGRRLWCWGSNDQGQLGDGTFTDRTSPVRVQAPGSFVHVGAGAAHTCAVRDDGLAFCWGRNQLGEAGIGLASAAPVPPTPVAGGLRWAAVEAGETHTCGLTSEGVAHCWGANSRGQLGTGNLVPATAPTRVSGARVYRRVSAGRGTSCVLDTEGLGWCWGENRFGQVAEDPGSTLSGVPLLRSSEPLVSLATGGESTCALRARGGAECWGVPPGASGAVRTVHREGWNPFGSGAVEGTVSVGGHGLCLVDGFGILTCL